MDHLSLCTWAFVRSMKRHLSPESEDEANFKAELYERMPKAQAQKIIMAAHRPNRALYDLSMAIENLPMHFMRKNEMHAALTIFEDNLGSSERLLTSPVPLIYNRHTARFLTVWLFILPVALWEPFGFMWYVTTKLIQARFSYRSLHNSHPFPLSGEFFSVFFPITNNGPGTTLECYRPCP